MKITGTFLDAVLNDIPSANWGPDEWARDFDAMKAIGIDTVILIRSGLGDQATFESKVLRSRFDMRPVYLDLVDVFLTEAERCGMDFFFGTYNSNKYWRGGQPEKEIEINKAFLDEVIQRYGDRKAFKGWYVTQEISVFVESAVKVYEQLPEYLKSLKDIPILLSPSIRGAKEHPEDFRTPQQHEEIWNEVFSRLQGLMDIVAFQDGHVKFTELPTYLKINADLAKKYGFRCWSNVETFERGIPIRFLPIAWQNLRYKIEAAADSGVERLITFEFSHFMSPNSPYQSAHNLYNRYREWLAESRQ